MQRRDYIKALAVPGTVAVAGCSGTSEGEEGTATLPETVKEAMTEAEREGEETERETATTTEEGPAVLPLDWRTYARDGANTRHVPDQSVATGEYDIRWTHSQEGDTIAFDDSRVIAGGETLFVQSNRDHIGSRLLAVEPTGELRWERTDAGVGGIVYADGLLAGITWDGDVLVMDPETGEREALVTDVDAEPDTSLNQVAESGLFVSVTGDLGGSTMTVVDLTAGEIVRQEEVEAMAGVYEVLIADGRIVFVGAAPVESSRDDNPIMVQVRDLETGDITGEFEETWLRDDEMGYPDWSTTDGETVYTMANRSGLQYDDSRYGMIAYSRDGSLQWKAPELVVNETIYPPLLDDDHVYLVSESTVNALDRATGEVQWTYENADRFSPGSLVTDDRLVVPDLNTNGGARVHSIDTASGDAERVQFFTEDESAADHFSSDVRLRPATEGFYVRGAGLHYVAPVDGEE
ncbi:PQQ-binding-like beta-propeller repeat protein [Halobaculum rarum]|uniref:outer membrane protein assembly factor BamB family protein n=1 Tax=Halobaculum rarum TaxID=3075122 RepID=UPI0032AF1620